MATVLFLSDWNWSGAERSLTRALGQNPEHSQAQLLYGQLLESQGRLEAGLRMKTRALKNDPHSAQVHLAIGQSYWNQRNFEESIRWANKALELDSRHLLAREFLAGASWKIGDFEGHLRELARHAECFGVPAAALDRLDRAIDDHDPSLVYLAVGPQFDRLRADVRFSGRLKRLGLPRLQ